MGFSCKKSINVVGEFCGCLYTAQMRGLKGNQLRSLDSLV